MYDGGKERVLDWAKSKVVQPLAGVLRIGVVNPIYDKQGKRDISREYILTARKRGGELVIQPTLEQGRSLENTGGFVPDEYHVTLENGSPE